MTASTLVDYLLEGRIDPDDVGDPKSFIHGTIGREETWKVPHPWVAILRRMGFELRNNNYKNADQVGVQYWSMERHVKMKSGEDLELNVSGYDQPDMLGKVALTVRYDSRGKGEASHVWDSRPIDTREIKRVVGDVLRRIERTKTDYVWNSYSRGVAETMRKVLAPYGYWTSHKLGKTYEPLR